MSLIKVNIGPSKSANRRKAVVLAKQIPGYAEENDTVTCCIDSIESFCKYQIEVLKLILMAYKWKTTTVLLSGKEMKTENQLYRFLVSISKRSGAYEKMIRTRNFDSAVSLGDIVYEDLPMPYVYYPKLYGAFFAFAESIDGDLYFCECEREAIENYIELRKTRKGGFAGSKGYPLGSDRFPEQVAQISNTTPDNPTKLIKYKENLCFRCNNKIPKMKYCLPMYGGEFKQKFGWYLQQEKLRLGMDTFIDNFIEPNKEEITPELYDYMVKLYRMGHPKTEEQRKDFNYLKKKMDDIIENNIRSQFGVPAIGDYWVSETIMYRIIKRIYPEQKVKRHYRPEWLDHLELDIYIPELKLGFEYQGIQHFKAVDHWGGEEKLIIQQEHDQRKIRLCNEHGVKLIHVNYDDDLTEEFIRSLIG